jgi:ubiquinol-cytochrome c reductase cytochrome c1 subunit
MRSFALAAVAALFAATAILPALAAEEAPPPPPQDWSFSGPFGTYDRSSAQRGFQVYKEVCSSCHGMYHLAYRNLMELGLSEPQVRALAADYMVTDGPGDDGEMFQRPALPSDPFVRPFPNEQAARASNGGAYPPDLSVMNKARGGGADYVYALLTGYEPAPGGMELAPGMYYNRYFPGHQIAMAPPVMEGGVEYADGTPNSVAQMARDVTTFMAWAAEPEMERRKQTGVSVILFLIVLSGMLFAVKRKVWSDVH